MLPCPTLVESVVVAEIQGRVPKLFGQFPNSSGGFACYAFLNADGWGSVQVSQGPSQNYKFQTIEDNVRNTNVTINLENSSAIYKNDVTTVQPAALYGLCLIRSH